MAENTEISWADDTFNPWEGCQKVSPACDGCYAEARNLRYAPKGTEAAPNWGPGAPRRRTSASNWAKPLKWEREQAAVVKEWRAAHAGEEPDMKAWRDCPPTRFVFCASLADVFDNAVPPEWRRDLFNLIRATPHLTWLLLTKRPQNIVVMVDKIGLWPTNAMAGTSIEDQTRLRFNGPALAHAKRALDIPTIFWSCEPLLEDLGDVSRYFASNTFSGRRMSVDWVITGGETDQGSHKARPSHPDWFRSLRDQCAAAGVAYHHKQNGEWAHSEDKPPPSPGARFFDDEGGPHGDGWHFWADGDRGANASIKVGKKAAGRLLDGVTHDARPAPR